MQTQKLNLHKAAFWMAILMLALVWGSGWLAFPMKAKAEVRNIELNSKEGKEYSNPIVMRIGDTGTFTLNEADLLAQVIGGSNTGNDQDEEDYPLVTPNGSPTVLPSASPEVSVSPDPSASTSPKPSASADPSAAPSAKPTLEPYHIQNVSFSTYDDELSVTETGAYTVNKVGRVILTVSYYYRTNSRRVTLRYYINIIPDLRSAKLNRTSVEGYYNSQTDYHYQTEIRILGAVGLEAGESYDLECVSSNKKMRISCSQEGDKISITAMRAGKTKLTLSLYDQTWYVDLVVYNVRLSGSTSRYLLKGKSTQLRIKGINKKISWKSTNSKVVKVSSKGKVRAKKEGNALIIAKVGDCKVGCVISVVSKKRKQVINTAIKIGKTCKYSQARRMQKGYYDCSSLVWRAYQKMGIRFGGNGYAPTAADNAKWCAAHHKIVKGNVSKNIRKMKYLPGALLYKTGDSSNGRYKGIYHVEMFIGYSFEGFDSKGRPILSTKWANRGTGYGDGYGLWSQP